MVSTIIEDYENENENYIFGVLNQLLLPSIDPSANKNFCQRPKITKITSPPVAQNHDAETNPGKDEPRLIETSKDAEEENLVPFQTKCWESKHGGVDCFLRLPYDALPEVAQATGTLITLEPESKRIRVSSLSPTQVDDALERLDNLEESLVSSF